MIIATRIGNGMLESGGQDMCVTEDERKNKWQHMYRGWDGKVSPWRIICEWQ